MPGACLLGVERATVDQMVKPADRTRYSWPGRLLLGYGYFGALARG